jgi:predicted DNA binding protein
MPLKRVVLSFRPPPTAWLTEINGVEGLSVQILDCVVDDDGSIKHLVMFRARDKATAEQVKRLVGSLSLVKDVQLFGNSRGGETLFGIVKSSACTVCNGLASQCFIRRGEYLIERERIVWRFVAPDSVIQNVMKYLEGRGVKAELLESVEVKDFGSVNNQQVQLIIQAFEAGYFDVPRKVSTRELAKNLGKTPATLSISLRRGLRRVLTNYLVVNNS